MTRLALASTAFLFAAVTLTGCTQPSGPTADEVLAQFLEADEPGCSAAVGQNGEVVWAGARGLANLDTKQPLTVATEFDMASVSKQFTALAILLLEQDGVLSLDDSLADWLEAMPADASLISLADLMHHTSGIADYTNLLDAEFTETTTQQDALDVIAGLSRLRGGGGFSYSNSNYVLLAEVVEAASGQPLAEFLDERVFGPLDLAMRLDPGYSAPTVATSYEAGEALEWGWLQVGDGAIFSTPSELVRWADNYRTGAVGGSALVAEQVTSTVDTGFGTYAAGIGVARDGSLSHLGGWAGFVTYFGVSADRATSIAVMCNSVDTNAEAIAGELQSLWGE